MARVERTVCRSISSRFALPLCFDSGKYVGPGKTSNLFNNGQSTAETRARLVQHVFVVDDEKIIASTLATILQLSGFTSRFFIHPRDALQAASTDTPDLLISDVMMPGLSGIDLAIQVRQIHPACRVLLLSGQAATADLLRAARDKGHDFPLLSKPIHPTELLARVNKLVNPEIP
jgi:DNA-binding NtrC family response regulator